MPLKNKKKAVVMMWYDFLIETKTIATLIGAAMGAARSITSSARKETPTQIAISVLCGQVLAAAVVEQFNQAFAIWGAVLVGIVCGSVGGYALDAVTALTPQALHSLVSMLLGKAGAQPLDVNKNDKDVQ